jgi:hypothetical protein
VLPNLCDYDSIDGHVIDEEYIDKFNIDDNTIIFKLPENGESFFVSIENGEHRNTYLIHQRGDNKGHWLDMVQVEKCTCKECLWFPIHFVCDPNPEDRMSHHIGCYAGIYDLRIWWTNKDDIGPMTVKLSRALYQSTCEKLAHDKYLDQIHSMVTDIYNSPGMPGKNESTSKSVTKTQSPPVKATTSLESLRSVHDMLAQIYDAPGMPGSTLPWKSIRGELFAKLINKMEE